MLQIFDFSKTHCLQFHMMMRKRSQLVLTIDAAILGNGSIMAARVFV